MATALTIDKDHVGEMSQWIVSEKYLEVQIKRKQAIEMDSDENMKKK